MTDDTQVEPRSATRPAPVPSAASRSESPRRGSDARSVALVAVFTALLVAAAVVPGIPVGGFGVPLTLQTLAVLLTGLVLGPARGTVAVLLYLVLGFVGLPVFSGGTSGLSIGHVSPEAAEGGTIALVEEGDRIRIDIPNRRIDLVVDDATLEQRRKAMIARGADAYRPNRDRTVSLALKAYALMATSAARGAVRDLAGLGSGKK